MQDENTAEILNPDQLSEARRYHSVEHHVTQARAVVAAGFGKLVRVQDFGGVLFLHGQSLLGRGGGVQGRLQGFHSMGHFAVK